MSQFKLNEPEDQYVIEETSTKYIPGRKELEFKYQADSGSKKIKASLENEHDAVEETKFNYQQETYSQITLNREGFTGGIVLRQEGPEEWRLAENSELPEEMQPVSGEIEAGQDTFIYGEEPEHSDQVLTNPEIEGV